MKEPSNVVPEPVSEPVLADSKVEILETPQRVPSRPAQVLEEPEVVVQDEPLHIEESVVEDAAKVFDGVIHMTTERVKKLAKHKKYAKSASSFPGYNFGQAFSRGLNYVAMVSSRRSVYLVFL